MRIKKTQNRVFFIAIISILLSKLPGYKALQAEIESLIKEKNSGYNDYRAKREEYRRLQTVKGNIDQILRRERKPVKKQEQER